MLGKIKVDSPDQCSFKSQDGESNSPPAFPRNKLTAQVYLASKETSEKIKNKPRWEFQPLAEKGL